MSEVLDCVVLAAGASTRMGRPKIHLPLGGSSIVGTTVANARAAGLRVIVVARPGDGRVGELAGPGVEIARNPDPGRGMLSSIKVGAALVRSGRFFFIPADMPFALPACYLALAAVVSAGPVIPTCGGRRGHPVLMPASLVGAILGLPESVPLRTLIIAAGPSCLELGDEGVLRDIDTVDDYEKAGRRAVAGMA